MPTTLNDIEALTARYAAAARNAADLAQEIEDEVRHIKRRNLSRLRDRAARAAEARSTLEAALKGAPELWLKPRTRVFHGIKVGFKKLPGALEWADETKVIAKIKQLYADQTDVLIKTVERPVKDALARLPADALKRLGITVADTGDEVVIKSATGDIEALMNALIGDLTSDDVEAA